MSPWRRWRRESTKWSTSCMMLRPWESRSVLIRDQSSDTWSAKPRNTSRLWRIVFLTLSPTNCLRNNSASLSETHPAPPAQVRMDLKVTLKNIWQRKLSDDRDEDNFVPEWEGVFGRCYNLVSNIRIYRQKRSLGLVDSLTLAILLADCTRVQVRGGIMKYF